MYTHMHFVQLDGLHDAFDYVICTDICDYTQCSNLYLSRRVVFECLSECACEVAWKSEIPSLLLLCMIGEYGCV